MFIDNLGALWSSGPGGSLELGAWGPGPNGLVVDPPLPGFLFVLHTTLNVSEKPNRLIFLYDFYHKFFLSGTNR